MESTDTTAVVVAFNDRINARDHAGLVALMTDDHTFVDPAGTAIVGRTLCDEAWRGIFATFPDSRNHFATLAVDTVTGE